MRRFPGLCPRRKHVYGEVVKMEHAAMWAKDLEGNRVEIVA